MKHGFSLTVLLLMNIVLFSRSAALPGDSLFWNKLAGTRYTIYYTTGDNYEAKKVNAYLESGVDHISRFLNHEFQDTFKVYIFPDRPSLDKQWQKDWNDPTFRSECWMIASGVAHRLDLLSPTIWSKQACDHNGNDSIEVRQVIWHELVHVFHGQKNPDHTFSYIEKLDWLVEGLATFVSGQLDEKRRQRVKQLVNDNKTPSTLDNFWKGQDKYGLSGSMVAYLDKKYGRQKLFDLLKQTKKENVLQALGVSENELLQGWRNSFE